MKNKPRNFEILFKDSPEYFYVERARMIFESGMVRFICFTSLGAYLEDVWFPTQNIHRIKTIL